MAYQECWLEKKMWHGVSLDFWVSLVGAILLFGCMGWWITTIIPDTDRGRAIMVDYIHDVTKSESPNEVRYEIK